MKKPSPTPAMSELIGSLMARPERIIEITRTVRGPTISGKYLHWEKLKYYPAPAGLDHREWWLGIKMCRRGDSIPLTDRFGVPFTFNLADPLPESLHEIDFLGGGSIGMPDQVTNPETRDSYLVRSLIEEAFTSSQLEGAASTREVAKELIRKEHPPRNTGERMILNNYKTMRHILEIKDLPLTPDLVFAIHRLVTEGTLDDPSASGRLRRDDEYRVVGDEYGAVFHEPPVADQLEGRLEALCRFANGGDDGKFLHPAIRSMILHFWLAYDHPFVDGNGRTARALFYWSMLKHGYWMFEFVSISHAILRSPTSYGLAFLETETDENDLTYFLLYHTEVALRSIKDLNAYVDVRSKELTRLESELRGMAHLKYRQRELISHALRHPNQRYTVESHRASHNISRPTASKDLLDLVRRGLLRRMKGGLADYFLAMPDLEARLRKMG